MPRFADSKEIVANEDVEPIDSIYEKFLKTQTLSPLAEHHLDTVERVGQNHQGLP